MNREYGKIEEDGRLTYAPSVIWIGDSCICNPQEPDYNQVGWFKVFDEKPSEKVGVYFIPDGWEYVMRDGRKVIVRTYREEPLTPPPPPVTRYSGWKMYKAIKAEGYGESFNELMKNNIEVMIAFVRPQYFLSDDADFTAMVTQMCAALHIDDETKKRILAASVDEEVR